MPRRSSPARRQTHPSQLTPVVAKRVQADLQTGDIGAVLGRGLRRSLQTAAADPGLDFELGALRIAIARLLRDEQNLDLLANNVARLARVAVQIAAVRGPDRQSNELDLFLKRTLDELDAEAAQKNRLPPWVDPPSIAADEPFARD